MNDDLREQLRRADPAASLRPITPEATSRLLEKTMTKQQATRPLLLVAAAAVAVLAVSAAALTMGREPSPTPDPVAAPTAQSVTKLSSVDAAGAKCPAPEAQRLAANAQLAFEGTVLRIEGDVVTLKVKHVWTGVRTDLVEVNQVGEHTAALLAGSVLKVGETYLIAASADGQVMSCNYSGLDEPERRALFDAAF